MKTWRSQVMKIRWVVAGFPFQMFKLLQSLFRNMRSCVDLVGKDTFSICQNRPFFSSSNFWNSVGIPIFKLLAISHKNLWFISTLTSRASASTSERRPERGWLFRSKSPRRNSPQNSYGESKTFHSLSWRNSFMDNTSTFNKSRTYQ